MSWITRALNALAQEPVAVTTAVVTALELASAVQHHHVTSGIVTAVVMALVGLFTRAQVTPTAPSD